jgi:hypothetical protein
MDPADLVLFNAAVGGREANDANNKKRENMIIAILNTDLCVAGVEWDGLRGHLNTWVAARKAELGLPPITPHSVIRRAGRRYNWDFDLRLGEHILKCEFKFGATSVNSLPEFFNPSAKYDFHGGESYARFFFANYLPRVCELYAVPLMMSEDEYWRKVHGTSKTPALFQALYDAEKNGTAEYKAQKKAIVDDSIAAWLERVKEKTNIAAITAAFQTSQVGKQFMLCSEGQFCSDKIDPEELVVTGVIGVRLGKYLVLKSAKPGTTHEMLLRWKNHAGILYPAWQISLRRA